MPPGRPELLARAIRDAHDGKYDLDAMGARGREWVEREADRSVAVRRYRDLLLELASLSSSRAALARRARARRGLERLQVSERRRLRRAPASRVRRPADPPRRDSRPETRSEYYTPPGFYALAGAATVVGEHVHAGDPHKLGQVLNWLVLLATAGVLWLLARELFPRRPWLQLSALAFFCFLPVVLRVGAMFHPEPLSMLLSRSRCCSPRACSAVATTAGSSPSRRASRSGSAQLVRAFSLWTFAAVVLGFAAARAWRPLLVIVRRDRGRRPRPGTSARRSSTAIRSSTVPRRTRRSGIGGPRRFYVGLGLPDVFTDPIRPHFRNEAIPTTYSEVWGDYFGVWSGSRERQSIPRPAADAARARGLGRAAGTLARESGPPAGRRCSRASGILGYLYFTVSYPTPDGDVLKASYMLTTAPAWALAFGYAVDRLPGRARLVVAAILGRLGAR